MEERKTKRLGQEKKIQTELIRRVLFSLLQTRVLVPTHVYFETKKKFH